MLRKKLGVEEAKAAILGDGAAEGPSEMHRVTRAPGNVWGDLVPSCWEEKGLLRSTRLARTGLEQRPARGKEAGNHLAASKQPVDFPDEK